MFYIISSLSRTYVLQSFESAYTLTTWQSSYSYITYKWNSVFTLLVRHRQNELSWFAYICQVIYNGQLKLLLIYLPIVSNPCWGPRNKHKDDYRPLSGNLIFLNWFIGKEDQTLVWKCILFNLNIGDRTTSVLVYLFVYKLHSKTTIWKQIVNLPTSQDTCTSLRM